VHRAGEHSKPDLPELFASLIRRTNVRLSTKQDIERGHLVSQCAEVARWVRRSVAQLLLMREEKLYRFFVGSAASVPMLATQ